jgi:MFS family permease
MHADLSPSTVASPSAAGPWWRELNGYHWFVLIVAALGWLFDTMDQQLFNIARAPAVAALLGPEEAAKSAQLVAGITTMIFILGWATGGLIFGVMGDRVGRARTMLITIVVYSAFTGLSALSVGIWDFALYRFLTGLGVGGEFAVGVALVAEVMPERARIPALGWLQALSAVGNCTAAIISMALGRLAAEGALGEWAPWRVMFVIGTLPAILVIFVMSKLREPEKWRQSVAAGGGPEKRGSYAELFGNPELRYRALVGLALGFSGVVGLWGIGFFSFDLMRVVFRSHFEQQAVQEAVTAGTLSASYTTEQAAAAIAEAKKAIEGNQAYWVGIASLLQNLGGFFGVLAFSKVTQVIGRRPTFAIAFLLAMGGTALTFSMLNSFDQIFWMIPLLGFCQLTLFGGYAIYFPELFPTRLRSTGTSFCYNVGRYLAAFGPLTLGLLADRFYKASLGFDSVSSLRYAGLTMCLVFLIGLAAVPFAPETKGKPLPE